MWILFKLIASGLALAYRFGARYFGHRAGTPRQFGDVTIRVEAKRQRNRVNATFFRTALECKSVFKVTRETRWDSLFKTLGLADELQTGDRLFDERFYVACDSPAFCRKLTFDVNLRAAIAALFSQGCEYVLCDGSTLTVRFLGDRTQDALLPQVCADLRNKLSDLTNAWQGDLHDPFARRILAAEALVWAIAAYAGAGFVSWIFEGPRYLDLVPLLRIGTIVGVLTAGAMLTIVALLFKGSSRGHRVLVESFVVLCVSIPLGAIQTVSDINVKLDPGTQITAEFDVIDMRQTYRRSKGREYRSFYLYVLAREIEPGIVVPGELGVSPTLFSRVNKGSKISIRISRGYLNIPRIDEIEPVDPTSIH